MTYVESPGNIAGKSVVAIKRDRAENPVMMAAGLAVGNNDRAALDRLEDAAANCAVRDLLDEDVTLCPETNHMSHLLRTDSCAATDGARARRTCPACLG